MNQNNSIKNILVATPLYPPEMGGPATYTSMLEEHLPSYGYELTVVPFGKVRHLPKVIRHIAYLRLLLREGRACDLIYTLDGVSVGLPARIASVLLQKRLILRVPGDYAWEQGQQRFGVTQTLDDYAGGGYKKTGVMVRLLRWLQTGTANRAVKIITPSNYMRDIVSSWGIPKEKIATVYSALFPLEVTAPREELRRQLAYDGFVIVSAGRLVPWKGFPTVIKMVAELREAIPNVTLVIAGDGPVETELQALVKELGLEQTVRLVGRLSKDALGATIKAADVFVLNTAYEGLSHQLLEVMDLKVPIVTTAVGGNPELITHDKTGYLCAFDDQEALLEAVRDLAHTDAIRERLVVNAKGRANDFRKEKVVQDLVQVLKTL